MSGKQRTMKLKVRIALLTCGILTFCAIFVAVNELPTLRGAKHSIIKQYSQRNFEEDLDQSHIFTFRKRLNKSNYSSDNLSPEGSRHVQNTKVNLTETADTVEDIKDKDTSLNQDTQDAFDNHKTFQNAAEDNKRVEGHVVPLEFNATDSYVDKLLHLLQTSNGLKFNFDKTKEYSYAGFLKLHRKRTRRKGAGLPIYRNYNGGPVLSNWERFHKGIHQYGLYSPDDPAINGILDDMVSEQIVDIEMKEGGTQLKLIITFSDEGQALFKPMRHSRDQETLPDHFYFVDFERHNSEIAAFHLDRILGFYRVPPTTGREINMTQDIKRLGDSKLKKTFFISPANNVCFHGTCSYYCDTGHAVCGHPDMLEGSFATFLPPERIAPRKTWRNPWKRSYSKHRKAYWEVYDDLCVQVQEKDPFNSGRRLLDIIDMHIFDFLTGNMDRHHYETFVDFGNETFLLHLDNGRGFGRPDHDEISILAPLYQCCLIRYSTFMKLVKLYIGPDKLSTQMRTSTMRDSVSPILTDKHLRALDRRVIKVLKTLHDCMETSPYTDVIIDDFF